MNSLVLQEKDKVLTLTLTPDTAEIVGLFDKDKDRPEGVRLVSQGRFRSIISKALVDNFIALYCPCPDSHYRIGEHPFQKPQKNSPCPHTCGNRVDFHVRRYGLHGYRVQSF